MAGGQVSAEVTFNSAELESWDLWSDCWRSWNDLGMTLEWSLGISQKQSLPPPTQHRTSQLCLLMVPSTATQDPSFHSISLAPSVNSMVRAMCHLLHGQPFPCPCLSLDALPRTSGVFISNTLQLQPCLAGQHLPRTARQCGLPARALLGVQMHPRL